MKNWPKFKDFISFKPTVEYRQAKLGVEDEVTEQVADNSLSPEATSADHWQKIKFDNAIRLLIAVPSYVACVALWSQGAIRSLSSISVVFGVYGALLFLANWIFMGSRFARKFDFLFASVDLMGMSMAIYYTGGTESALYFLYFIPIIVHAFHRDRALVLFAGFGGVVLYGIAILISLPSPTAAILTNLGARLFFMLLTVSVACLALNLLCKKEDNDRRQILRLKTLTLVVRELHHSVSLDDLTRISTRLVQLMNEGLGEQVHGKTHFIFDNTPPTVTDGTENSSFESQVSVPVTGTENESFGTLIANSHLPNAFKEDEIRFLEFVARSLGLAFQRLHRMEELRKSLEMNSCVLAASIASARSAEETFVAVLDGLQTILHVEKASFMLWDEGRLELKTVKTMGPCTLVERELSLRLGEGCPGKALEEGGAVCSYGSPQSLLGQNDSFGIKSLLCVPLKTIKGERLGVICAARTDTVERFSNLETELVSTFSVRAALAIENALMHQVERARTLIPKDTHRADIRRAA